MFSSHTGYTVTIKCSFPQVWTWGEPWGDFSMNVNRNPRKVDGAKNIAKIACGAFHNLALSWSVPRGIGFTPYNLRHINPRLYTLYPTPYTPVPRGTQNAPVNAHRLESDGTHGGRQRHITLGVSARSIAVLPAVEDGMLSIQNAQ